MQLAKYVKFREEKFGGVLFETRSEKVYTLTPTAAAVVQEIAAGPAPEEIAPRLAERFEGPEGASSAKSTPSSLSYATRDWWKVERADRRLGGPLRAALRRVADHQRVQPRLPALHRGSGPGKAFRDELDRDQAFGVIDQLMDNEVPYLSFSGGEPMLHPHFFEMVERVTSKGSQLKIETNGHYLTPDNCRVKQKDK